MKTKFNKINLMLPTYNRPESIVSFVSSALETADNYDDIRFTFCINISDLESAETIKRLFPSSPNNHEIIFEETEQPNLAFYFNLMYEKTKFSDSGTLVSMVGDDMVFKTQGWDSEILRIANETEGLSIIYCNDNYIAGETLCVNLFTSRRLIEAQKKPFMCEYFHADMIDVVWMNVGIMTGLLRYLPKVIIQHNHNTRKPKEQWDDTFQRIAPVQAVANSASNQRLCVAYSTVCARNIIESGVGEWNRL